MPIPPHPLPKGLRKSDSHETIYKRQATQKWPKAKNRPKEETEQSVDSKKRFDSTSNQGNEK